MLTPENKWKIGSCAILLIAAILFSGCSDAGSRGERDFLIKVGDRKVSVFEFNRAFEVVKMAYSGYLSDDPQLFLEAKSRLLKDMIEELIILERAEEIGVEISEEELNAAIAEIKADYPEASFEQVLLENAISFSFWKENLQNRLLKQKVIEKEILETIRISPGEIEEFYLRYFGEQKSKPESKEESEILTNKIILQLRREKAKAVYPEWIRSLREKYKVIVNRSAWDNSQIR